MSTPVADVVDGFDLFDTTTFAHGHPHAAYDRIRAEHPVMRHPGSAKQPPFWVLTRHADIHAVSMDGERFTSTRGFRLSTDSRAGMDPEISRILSRFMLAMDRPEHDTYRALVSGLFTPQSLKALEPRINQSVTTLMDSLEGRSEVEFVSQVAAIVPIKTVCAIFGLPPEDEKKVFDLTNSVFGTDDPDYSPSLEEANRNYLAIFDYGMELIEQRRKAPREDLLTVLAHATIDGEPLGEVEQKSFFSNMLAAGNETTRSSLAGAVWALSRNKGERDRLVADPALIPGAINELLRYFSPVYQMMRTAKVDLEIGGQAIGKDERVVMLYGAGNHDPAVFEDPHRLDVTRANAGRHLTFGVGVHHCLGSRLAGLQLRAILGEFLRRFPKFEVVGEPAYVNTNFVGAMKSLPVRLQG
jgi:cytochrome P450